MENKFASLEAESVKKADTYLSIAKKTAIVKLLAPGCIEQVCYRKVKTQTFNQSRPAGRRTFWGSG